MPHITTKPNLILDLDQTIISAETTTNHDFKKYRKKSLLFDSDDMMGLYMVYSRPHLQEFLDYIFTHFNVTIWTAASKDYALFIIEKIILNKKKRKLDFIFFSYHCNISKKIKKSSKDLSNIWNIYKIHGYSSKNTVIIDDYKLDVYKSQPNNCIIATPFEFKKIGSENDTFLIDIIPHLRDMKKRINDYSNDIATSVNVEMKTI